MLCKGSQASSKGKYESLRGSVQEAPKEQGKKAVQEQPSASTITGCG